MRLRERLGLVTFLLPALLLTAPAHAQQAEPIPPIAPPAPSDVAAPAPPAPPIADHQRNVVPVVDEHADERGQSAVPTAAAPPPPKITFAADPVADGGIIVGAAAFAGLLELINGTGEIRPQQISADFDRSRLLGIDRATVDQTADEGSRLSSNIGLFAACGFAAIDPVLTAIREKHLQSGIVDAVIYAESIALTWGVTNLAKMAVRRPRPAAYIEFEANRNNPNYSNVSTDSNLSFFSGHASMTAAISTTATYLAFARSPRGARGWITLGVGTALTSFVSIERVRAAAHFPTDVIAGAIAGIGIGIIVPHLHRNEEVKQRRVWMGYAPERGGGGSAQVGGEF